MSTMTWHDPFGSPEPIPTPKFPSPNSPLPQKELERLKECIEAANDLLRTLGNPRDNNNLTQLRLHFQSLRGAFVKAEVDCKNDLNETVEVLGILTTAGRDFIQISAFGEQKFVLYERLCSLHHQLGQKQGAHEPELLCIDPCLREELVLHFGEILACNPDLINIFLGIPLHLHLLSFVGCNIAVKLEGNNPIARGVLVDSEEGRIRVSVHNDCLDFNFNEICVITVFSDHVPKNHAKKPDPEEPDPEEPHH